MLTHCLTCKKNTKNVNSKALKTKTTEQCYYQNMLYAVVKSPEL